MDKYYTQIKNELINNEITKQVKIYSINKSDLTTYYNIGKILNEAGNKYDEGIIKKYSIQLTNELNKKYSERYLRRTRQFFIMVKKLKWSAMPTTLTWSHYTELLPLNDINKIRFYITLAIDQNLSYRKLREKIKSNEYERLPDEIRIKLQNNNDIELKDFIKNPIIIHNTNSIEILKEKTLQKLILEDIPSFLEELGEGFTFIKNEYKIKIGDRYNYIDLLLFNYKYNSFVVIELKITELRKEYIGQIHTYMNYIDTNLKTINHNKTIGIIICKKDNKFIMEYSSDDRILSREYQLI